MGRGHALLKSRSFSEARPSSAAGRPGQRDRRRMTAGAGCGPGWSGRGQTDSKTRWRRRASAQGRDAISTSACARISSAGSGQVQRKLA